MIQKVSCCDCLPIEIFFQLLPLLELHESRSGFHSLFFFGKFSADMKKWEVKFRLLAFYISFFSLKELKFDINIHKSYSFAGLQSTKIMPLRNQKRSEKTKEELFLLLQSWFYDWKEFMKLFALLYWVIEKMTWVKFTWIISQVHLSRVKPSWMISQVDLSRVKPTWKAYLNYRSSQLETSRLNSS